MSFGRWMAFHLVDELNNIYESKLKKKKTFQLISIQNFISIKLLKLNHHSF